MKTLILNGSTRHNGDTDALIRELTAHLNGDIKIVSCLDRISPCADCRYCWQHEGCAIRDGMQEVYAYWSECDNVVLASPVWFSSLSGPLLNLASRFQTLFAGRRFRGEKRQPAHRKGLLLLAGGQPGTEQMPIQAAQVIFRLLGVQLPCVDTVCSMDTDRLPASQDEEALSKVREAARVLNGVTE